MKKLRLREVKEHVRSAGRWKQSQNLESPLPVSTLLPWRCSGGKPWQTGCGGFRHLLGELTACSSPSLLIRGPMVWKDFKEQVGVVVSVLRELHLIPLAEEVSASQTELFLS